VVRLKTGNAPVTWHWSSFAWKVLQWKSNKYYIFWVCVCSLTYPERKTRASYYIAICGLSGSTIFFVHYIINGTTRFWEEKLLNIKFVFIFSKIVWNICNSKTNSKRLRWSRGSVLAFSTQVRGFKPGRNRRIFKGEKILSTPSFGGEVKPSVPCRRFGACKRSLNVAI
jgi:hypothetical protein